jgi:NADPH:quinone reductase-like Zn-dependent oxidoreductase
VLGRDVAGDVIALGSEVTKFSIGEYVFGMPGIERGGYAEYVILKETEAAHVPAVLDYLSAAAVPLAALTAWQGLFRHGGLRTGQSVLIHGGSGGVGHFAIQFAKARGAHVITTVGPEHVAFASKLGADRVIDYKAQRFEDEVADVDMVFDLIGGETQERSFACVKRGGVLVSTLNEPSQEKAKHHGIRALRYTVEESGEELAEIGRLIEVGLVKPQVSKVFPLDEAAEAQVFIEKSHPEGKVVLAVDGNTGDLPVASF